MTPILSLMSASVSLLSAEPSCVALSEDSENNQGFLSLRQVCCLPDVIPSDLRLKNGL